MSKPILEFTVFCIEEVARKLQLSGDLVYDLLTRRSDILYAYIVPSYEALHSQSRNYIVDDIISLMRERGVIA